MTTPRLSIVILNYNTRDLLENCLGSIQTHSPDAEPIVVDNGSADDSANLVRQKYPWARLHASPINLGFARGMNLGWASTTAPWILALNADTELLPATLPPLFKAASTYPHAGILGPAHLRPAGEAVPSAFPDPTLWREIARQLFADALLARLRLGPWQTRQGPPRQVDSLMGAALLLRRACVSALGGFDEMSFMYGEDWDLCFRARRAGWGVLLVPEAKIIHHENAAGATAYGPRRMAAVTRANLYFHRKHYGRASGTVLAMVTAAGSLLRILLLAIGLPLRPLVPGLRRDFAEYRYTLLATLDSVGDRRA